MARTIRLNTATGAAAGGAAGLTTADVEKVVEDKARWILDYEKDYGDSIPSGWLPLIPAIDFDNCFSYKVLIRGFGPNSGTSRMDVRIQSGASPISGTSNYNSQGNYNTNGSSNGFGANSTFSNGNYQPSSATYDSASTGGAQNMKEFVFFFNRSDAPNTGRRYFSFTYIVYPPQAGGYQQYGSRSTHEIIASQDFDNIAFGFSGGAFYSPTSASVTPVIQVYKQLRAPAS
tara:strand:+ start:10008 stop:10700 length:693 start_codon:yes stop_codon:yes gene_type:complete